MKTPQPPKLARKLFEWYCGQANVQDLLGDIDELFHIRAAGKSAFRAKFIYWMLVISLMFSYAVRTRKRQAQSGMFASSSFSMAMLNNYFKVAARSLYKHKYFSTVNAVGLAIGMSVSLLLIVLYAHVCTFDNFHTNKSEIYRVVTSHHSDREWELAFAPFSVADDFNNGFAGIKKTVKITSGFSADAFSGKLEIPIRGFFTEPSFFEVFTFPLIKGNASTALVQPNGIVLSESTAKKIFNRTDVLGESIEFRNVGQSEDSTAIYQVTGVMSDPPANSHMSFEVLISHSTLKPYEQTYEGNYRAFASYGHQYIYFLVENEASVANIQKRLSELGSEASKRADAKISFRLQALTDINPGRELMALTGGLGPQWDTTGFVIFGVISLLILLPACFNYTNISIARALKRSKEIGLRKTMGGMKNHIFLQFIVETVLIVLVSLLGALLIFYFIRSEFKSMMIGGSTLDLSLTWPMSLIIVAFAVFTGFMAGVFPALHFAGLNPIRALRGNTGKQSSNNRLRKGLTIFQFSLSFCFILALVVFSRQYRYTLNYDFGFQHKNILNVQLQDADTERFRNEFSQLAVVRELSMSSHTLGTSRWIVNTVYIESNDSFDVFQIFADHNYLNVLKLTLLTGRNFPNEVWQREKYILVNEEFVKQFKLGSPADAVGKIFKVENDKVEIIGVLKNFNYSKLNAPIEAFMIRMNPAKYAVANLSVSFTDAFSGLEQMEKTWNKINPEQKFEASFLDDEIREAYKAYEVVIKLVGFLGLLAISISLLGLLGMVVYNSETKTKEVGIRKVMGASIGSITLLLSKDYFKLMLWGALLAIPFTVAISDKILAIQYYHVSLNFWDVLLSLAILLTMGLATIASQTFKTASTNPAETLRTE